MLWIMITASDVWASYELYFPYVTYTHFQPKEFPFQSPQLTDKQNGISTEQIQQIIQVFYNLDIPSQNLLALPEATRFFVKNHLLLYEGSVLIVLFFEMMGGVNLMFLFVLLICGRDRGWIMRSWICGGMERGMGWEVRFGVEDRDRYRLDYAVKVYVITNDRK